MDKQAALVSSTVERSRACLTDGGTDLGDGELANRQINKLAEVVREGRLSPLLLFLHQPRRSRHGQKRARKKWKQSGARWRIAGDASRDQGSSQGLADQKGDLQVPTLVPCERPSYAVHSKVPYCLVIALPIVHVLETGRYCQFASKNGCRGLKRKNCCITGRLMSCGKRELIPSSIHVLPVGR
jgi:hypothetical protein